MSLIPVANTILSVIPASGESQHLPTINPCHDTHENPLTDIYLAGSWRRISIRSAAGEGRRQVPGASNETASSPASRAKPKHEVLVRRTYWAPSPPSYLMKIINPDGTVEIRETINPRRRWSPSEILALDLPPDPLMIDGKNCRRQTAAEIKEKRAKRAKAAREKRKSKAKKSPKP